MVLSYNTWLLAALNPHPRPLSGFISELAAGGQPFSWLFRAGDGLTGLLLLLLAWRGRTGWRSRYGAAAGWVALSLALAGAATILDVLAPMACAPTFSPACREIYDAAQFGSGFALHTVASVLVPLGVAGSLVAAGLGRRGLSGSGGVGHFALAALTLVLGLGSWVVELTRQSGQGYVQAVQVVLFSLWFGALALSAAAGHRAAGAGRTVGLQPSPGPGAGSRA
ncbi:DUF998 domain-containing protein [Blastococcus sp. SYSU D00695]